MSTTRRPHTDDTLLQRLRRFRAALEHPEAADLLFLANIQPDLRRQVRAQCPDAGFVGFDTMNLWIDTAKESLEAAISGRLTAC